MYVKNFLYLQGKEAREFEEEARRKARSVEMTDEEYRKILSNYKQFRIKKEEV